MYAYPSAGSLPNPRPPTPLPEGTRKKTCLAYDSKKEPLGACVRLNMSQLGIARVASLAFSRPTKLIWLFLSVGLKFFYNLLSSWPIFTFIEVYIVKSKNFSFLKQDLAFFSYKHLPTLAGVVWERTPPPPPPPTPTSASQSMIQQVMSEQKQIFQ